MQMEEKKNAIQAEKIKRGTVITSEELTARGWQNTLETYADYEFWQQENFQRLLYDTASNKVSIIFKDSG